MVVFITHLTSLELRIILDVIMRLDQPYRQDVLYELMTFPRAGFVLGTLEPAYLRLCLSDFEIFRNWQQ